MRQVSAHCFGLEPGEARVAHAVNRVIATVTTLGTLASNWQPDLHYLVPLYSDADAATLGTLQLAGLGNLTPVMVGGALPAQDWVRFVTMPDDGLEAGDVVALDPSRRHAEVLMRASDVHHTVFLTNRCNSRCVMCSQPPTEEDDGWRVEEALELARQMTWSPPVIGFTGGEPTLLGVRLRAVLQSYARRHPRAQLEVLTNARLVGDDAFARQLFEALPPRLCWMVPLYGHAPFLHDYVVQSEGAFDDTLRGLLNLQRHAQPVQLRVVLIRPVLEILPALADFVARNLPFVREVALMGCEPVGFALAHRADCEVDLRDWQCELRSAVRRLERGNVPVLLMNTPLCGLESDLWRYAHRSISDWKRTYAPACSSCAVMEECCGLFAWYERGWAPTAINPLQALGQLQDT